MTNSKRWALMVFYEPLVCDRLGQRTFESVRGLRLYTRHAIWTNTRVAPERARNCTATPFSTSAVRVTSLVCSIVNDINKDLVSFGTSNSQFLPPRDFLSQLPALLDQPCPFGRWMLATNAFSHMRGVLYYSWRALVLNTIRIRALSSLAAELDARAERSSQCFRFTSTKKKADRLKETTER